MRIRNKTLLQKLKQLASIHLIRKLYATPHGVEYNARGTALGIFVALSPTIGAQIPILGLLWLLLKEFYPRWQFNLLIASAWTLTTNVLTAPPLFYLYVVTGRLMLGRFDALKGYESFQSRLEGGQPQAESFLEGLIHNVANLFDTFGLPLMIGWIPWACLASWLGYRWAVKVIARRRQRKAVRLASTVSPSRPDKPGE